MQVDENHRIITDETNKDVTHLLEKEIQSFIKLHSDVDEITLKSKSPSCGLETTPIMNEDKKVIGVGSGIGAKMLKEYYEKIQIKDENSFICSLENY